MPPASRFHRIWENPSDLPSTRYLILGPELKLSQATMSFPAMAMPIPASVGLGKMEGQRFSTVEILIQHIPGNSSPRSTSGGGALILQSPNSTIIGPLP